MNVKIILYILIIPLTVYILEGLNINHIFKKNRVLQATLFYLVCTICISYLTVNFLYDVFTYSKIGGIVWIKKDLL
jgi:uncharacterized membrane protein YwzB